MKTSGLDGVVVAETRLSDVDGERGRLVLAGHDVEALAAAPSDWSFEAVAALLLATGGAGPHAEGGAPGGPPGAAAVTRARAALGHGRVAAFERLGALAPALALGDAMDALRASVGQLPGDTPDLEVVAAVGVFAAAWARGRVGRAPVRPDPDASHAGDLLRMFRGDDPVSAAEAAALERYLVTVVDHGLNASTFAARVVASTGSDRVSAVVAGLGALKGPLHGGAPGPVLDLLDAVGAPERAREALATELAAGRRIMGMGHRVYRVRDPRAAVLERAIEALERALPPGAPVSRRLALARAVEREAERLLAERHPERALKANVEFYTAVLLEAVGVPRASFTAVFAASRAVGWCAHVAEQQAHGRLLRPASRYVGPSPAAAAT